MAPIAPSCASWTNSPAYSMRKNGSPPAAGVVRRRVARLHAQTGPPQNSSLLAREWEQLTHHYQIEYGPGVSEPRTGMARRLLTLAQALELVPTLLMDAPLPSLRQLLD